MVFFNLLILWTNTTIQIPVFDSLEQYKYLPEATLLIDGQEVIDNEMYYQMEVDRTFFSVVNTAIIETYIVKYRVFFPTYQAQSTEVIYFDIVDNIPPEIIYIPQYKFPVGSKKIDLTSGIKLKDNYDNEGDLTITILNEDDINTAIPNTYDIVYEIKDLSNNVFTYHHSVLIYDNIPPVIIQTKNAELSIGDEFIYLNYFKVSDNINGVLNVSIDDSNVNYNLTGSYSATISAEDQSGNSTSYTFTIYIIDKTPPTIILKSNDIKIPLDDIKDYDFYRNHIISVFDNASALSKEDVIINDYVAYNMIGNYDVIYEITDTANNKTIKILKVAIIDLTPPTITLIKPLVVDVNSLYLNLDNYFNIKDNWTPYNNLKITYNSSYDLTKLGKYVLNVVAEDQFNNKTTETFILEVTDLIAPVIEVDEHIIINSINDLINHITVTDNYDLSKNIKITFDLDKVKPNSPGTYPVTITAEDSHNNKNTKEILVEISDLMPPLIKTSSDFYAISYEVDSIILDNILTNINLEITDNYTKENLIDISYYHNLKSGVVGSYTLTISATDLNNNTATKTITLIVEDKNPPEITNLMTFEFNKPTSLLEIEKQLIITDYSSNINIIWDNRSQILNKPGFYHLPLLLGDEYGNYTNYLITIKINKKPIYNNLSFWISLSLTSISIISIISYHIYTKKKTNRFDN